MELINKIANKVIKLPPEEKISEETGRLYTYVVHKLPLKKRKKIAAKLAKLSEQYPQEAYYAILQTFDWLLPQPFDPTVSAEDFERAVYAAEKAIRVFEDERVTEAISKNPEAEVIKYAVCLSGEGAKSSTVGTVLKEAYRQREPRRILNPALNILKFTGSEKALKKIINAVEDYKEYEAEILKLVEGMAASAESPKIVIKTAKVLQSKEFKDTVKEIIEDAEPSEASRYLTSALALAVVGGTELVKKALQVSHQLAEHNPVYRTFAALGNIAKGTLSKKAVEEVIETAMRYGENTAGDIIFETSLHAEADQSPEVVIEAMKVLKEKPFKDQKKISEFLYTALNLRYLFEGKTGKKVALEALKAAEQYRDTMGAISMLGGFLDEVGGHIRYHRVENPEKVINGGVKALKILRDKKIVEFVEKMEDLYDYSSGLLLAAYTAYSLQSKRRTAKMLKTLDKILRTENLKERGKDLQKLNDLIYSSLIPLDLKSEIFRSIYTICDKTGASGVKAALKTARDYGWKSAYKILKSAAELAEYTGSGKLLRTALETASRYGSDNALKVVNLAGAIARYAGTDVAIKALQGTDQYSPADGLKILEETVRAVQPRR